MNIHSSSRPHLFEPMTIKSVTLRNRIGVSPMCEYSSVDGAATDWHLVHLGSRAVGGAGLVVAEASAVSPEGRITPGDAGIWADKHVEPVARINRFLKEHGAVPGIQIAHAGRKASAARPWEGGAHLADQDSGWPIIAPSALAFGGDLTKVRRAMSLEEITRVQEEFVAAAKRSLAAGCEWLELHAAHGYLMHEVLSPISNRRTRTRSSAMAARTWCCWRGSFCAKPYWPRLAARVLGHKDAVSGPVQYGRAW